MTCFFFFFLPVSLFLCTLQHGSSHHEINGKILSGPARRFPFVIPQESRRHGSYRLTPETCLFIYLLFLPLV
ncbi:hypothetical protein B0T24DRAFT_406871 [Lasiosphaeria ovina]|uniref:Secreted protein n=1 Tax=Lasiosphaeria ovina TaxID=92902 RepID=A0AAE0JYB0_9PEZI|nr:hypothetical protein B0T24DRAFT_406871 [Lasiosphaeria ovina]